MDFEKFERDICWYAPKETKLNSKLLINNAPQRFFVSGKKM